MTRVSIEVLGSGTSVGVPSIGCHCEVCRSSDPRDKRLRPSVLLRYNGRAVLIDCGPDFRQQALRADMDRLDAIVLTHSHADHIMGIDDVRPFNFRQRQTIPVYGSRETIATVRQAFRYIFEVMHTQATIPKIETHIFTNDPFELFGLTFTPVPVWHGVGPTVHGFRFGSAAYLTDHQTIPEASMRLLENLDVLFLDGLRHRDHPTHSTVKQALANVARLKPRRAYLTHICHELGHAQTEAALPPAVTLSFDGLKLDASAQPPPRIFRSIDEVGMFFGPCTLTIGNFDGVHRGHRELMRMTSAHAKFNGWKAAALTFDPHPAKLVAPERSPRLLTRVEERCPLMAEEGIEQILVLPFDREIASLTPRQFVERILVNRLAVRHVFIGEDFRFGHGQAGAAAELEQLGREFGFTVEAIAKVSRHGRCISSTTIRRHLVDGRVDVAMRELGRPFALEGEVVRGQGIGSTQTVPTLNMAWTAEVIPHSGVYVTRTHDFFSSRVWPSITNIGFRPTFDGEGLTIETYLLEPLEGGTPRTIRVEFLHRVREERRFPSPADLRAQILRDVERARAYHRRWKRWVSAPAA
jgi:riboflavin kinase/FMN adenylyltransferase